MRIRVSELVFNTVFEKRINSWSSFVNQRDRLERIARHFSETGQSKREERGGNRAHAQDIEVKEDIQHHIESFIVCETHYSRNSTTKQYLSPELSIAEMWRLWKKKRTEKKQPIASLSKYKRIFYDHYNLGFGYPKTDVCSRCNFLENRIKEGIDTATNKIDLKLHKLRAKKFFQILKETKMDKEVLAISFDIEQNQPVPKLNVTETFYAQQIWVYNLTFVIHDEKGQPKNNVSIYTWDESESLKGSNEVVSALNNVLNQLKKRIRNRGYKKLALFSDSCGGQNKNKSMMVFLLKYVNNAVKNLFDSIQYYFPVRGYSYMPPDRVFGRIEKRLRKKEISKTPSEYHNIFSKFGRVKKLKTDWHVFNHKIVAETVYAKNALLRRRGNHVWEFKKNDFRIHIADTFAGTRQPMDVLKAQYRNARLIGQKAPLVRCANHITKAKMDDVTKLLPYLNLTPDDKRYYDLVLSSKPGNTVVGGDFAMRLSQAGPSRGSDVVASDAEEALPL